mmetsp:Transcript_10327/g.13543  ORF Transcript_10327/g.13543 Transcript_10327/m.13543 type:complete len:236 (-) Transcript_10327:1068-1775(-)
MRLERINLRGVISPGTLKHRKEDPPEHKPPRLVAELEDSVALQGEVQHVEGGAPDRQRGVPHPRRETQEQRPPELEAVAPLFFAVILTITPVRWIFCQEQPHLALSEAHCAELDELQGPQAGRLVDHLGPSEAEEAVDDLCEVADEEVELGRRHSGEDRESRVNHGRDPVGGGEGKDCEEGLPAGPYVRGPGQDERVDALDYELPDVDDPGLAHDHLERLQEHALEVKLPQLVLG